MYLCVNVSVRGMSPEDFGDMPVLKWRMLFLGEEEEIDSINITSLRAEEAINSKVEAAIWIWGWYVREHKWTYPSAALNKAQLECQIQLRKRNSEKSVP